MIGSGSLFQDVLVPYGRRGIERHVCSGAPHIRLNKEAQSELRARVRYSLLRPASCDRYSLGGSHVPKGSQTLCSCWEQSLQTSEPVESSPINPNCISSYDLEDLKICIDGRYQKPFASPLFIYC